MAKQNRSTGATDNRDKRIARHALRMGKTVKALETSGALSSPKFPKPHPSRPVERVVFSGQVKKQSGIPLHILICNGVTLAISPGIGEIVAAKTSLHPGMGFFHGIISPISGKISPVEARRCW